jgi:ribosome-binding factor A
MSMPVDRIERVNALLRREIGEALFHVFAGGGVDLAAVTVTRVETARNLRNATVYVSLLGHENERGTILHRLHARHAALQELINRDCHLKYTPKLRFVLDTSIEKGDRVLGVLSHLEEPAPGAESDTPHV